MYIIHLNLKLTVMKRILWFVLLMLIVLIGLTFCVDDDPLHELEKWDAVGDKNFQLRDSIENHNQGSVSPINNQITTQILPVSLDCTSVIVLINITGDGGNCVTEIGTCWSTALNPTIADNKWLAVEKHLQDYGTSFEGAAFNLQPGTLYHIRAYFITSEGIFYSDDISFTTNPAPTITTIGVTDITSTTAKVIGNIISTGGSFVVERGICFDTVPNLDTVIMRGGFGLANHFIEQEIQSVNGAGEFTISMTNLNPGTRYYVSTFVGVMAGLGYGDQLIEYGNEVSFTTKP